MRFIRSVTPLFCLLCVAGPRIASAQTIAGVVIDSATRQPARLLAVHVIDDSDHTVAEARTDTAGVFYALLTTGGAYRLRFALDSTTTFETTTIHLSDDGFVQREFVVALPRPYFDFEVEKQVQPTRGTGHPRYPQAMRLANIEGEVLAQFVVDSAGRPRLGTLRILRSPNEAFSAAVVDWLPTARFIPAMLGGRHVPQMVQQPFTFKLTGVMAPSEPPYPPPAPQPQWRTPPTAPLTERE